MSSVEVFVDGSKRELSYRVAKETEQGMYDVSDIAGEFMYQWGYEFGCGDDGENTMSEDDYDWWQNAFERLEVLDNIPISWEDHDLEEHDLGMRIDQMEEIAREDGWDVSFEVYDGMSVPQYSDVDVHFSLEVDDDEPSDSRYEIKYFSDAQCKTRTFDCFCDRDPFEFACECIKQTERADSVMRK